MRAYEVEMIRDGKVKYFFIRNMETMEIDCLLYTSNIWGRNWDTDIASLRVFMATLRKKLEPTKDSPQYIQTHIGVGLSLIHI